jgi:GT2 family glycosyltransferase
MRIAVIIPAYGREDLTHTAVADIRREDESGPEAVGCIVVDNQGGYTPVGDEDVLSPGENLGWLRGTNLGWRHALESGYDAYVLLNNDVRLSRGFFTGLRRAQELTGAGLVAPAYDSYLAHQKLPLTGDVQSWRPRRRHWRASFVDGTCLYVTADTAAAVGLLDEDFSEHGWGAEVDYSFRVWDSGRLVVVTALSYLHHGSQTTAMELHGSGYQLDAFAVLRDGLRDRYGSGPNGWSKRSGIREDTINTEPISGTRRAIDTARLELRAKFRAR